MPRRKSSAGCEGSTQSYGMQAGNGMQAVSVLQNRPGGEEVNDILLPNGPTLVLRGSPHQRTRLALPAPRERCFSMPEIGEKERDYLFKEFYRLRVTT